MGPVLAHACRVCFSKNNFFFALCTCHPERSEGTCCMNDSLFFPLIAAGVASVFCLETKGTKSSRNNDASTAEGKTPGPPFFHPTAREL